MTRGFSRLRRDDLLKTACEVISARGFGHTRTLDIAREAGVSQALLFYHFESKDHLFAQAFAYAARRDIEALAKLERSGGSALDRLRALLRLHSPTGSAKSWRLWIDAWAESMRSTDLEETTRRLDLRWQEAFQAIVEDGVAAGQFVCPDPEGTTWRLLSLSNGLAVQVTVHKKVLPRRRVAELLRTAAATELGLSPEDL
ncbi:TetR family transcriptional regulator C-terminal domain-containing protein [Nonomuraea sp. NPDC046570]|uniref:TetR/AcrR family transcriptional regulator n=1 Tax=Nonomuraea sp. NPDC046570 TaxID=3155255 RepID=UPI0033CD1C00